MHVLIYLCTFSLILLYITFIWWPFENHCKMKWLPSINKAFIIIIIIIIITTYFYWMRNHWEIVLREWKIFYFRQWILGAPHPPPSHINKIWVPSLWVGKIWVTLHNVLNSFICIQWPYINHFSVFLIFSIWWNLDTPIWKIKKILMPLVQILPYIKE